MYQIEKMPGSIDIGFVGETKSTKIEIDMTEWMKKYPDGVPSIIHIRPGESKTDAYVAVTEFDSATNVLTWEITAADIGTLEGDGDMQIWLEVAEDDEVVKRKKNKHVKTRVTDAVNDPDPTAPTSQAAFLEQVTEVKTATITAKEAAEDAQTAAETAQGAAEDAQEAAEGSAEDAEAYAKGTRDGSTVTSEDPAYHNNAKYYSEQAGASATAAGTAKTGAETAKDNAEAWAKGTKDGTAVPDTDPAYHNNAKYYSEQAAAATSSKANLTVIAPAFDQATANAAGSLVTYTDGKVYFLESGHTAGTTWANTTKAETNIGALIGDVKTAIHGIEENKAPIIKNKLSGNPVVFYDGINGVKLSEIIVHFNPVQEGTGTPSDENVRNVDLLDGITVYNSGSDTSNPNETEIDWSLSGSIVGGKINLITGEIYKTYEIITAKWGDIKGSVNQATGLASGKMTFANEVEQSTSQSAYTNGLTYCNVCATIMWKGDNFSPAHYYISSDFKTVWVAFPDNMDSNQIIQIVGKLKTPIKVATLTPVEISTLSGINKIWSDATGDCEIQYSADTEQFIRQRTNGYVTPEMYGAVGDGTTDDTNAITKAIWSGKRVIMDGVYYCTDLYLPENSEIEIHGSIKLHGTIYINKQNIDISGNGTIQAYATNTFMISPRANTIISNIKIRGLKIIGDNSKTCFAITNTEANGGICFVSINCDIHDFLYGVHSYEGSYNGTWFSAMAIDGTIRECVMAVHFDWMGTGSYIQSMIQPKVNASKTDDRPLVSISSNCIVTSMMWDYGQANNKIMLRITGINNKVLSALPHSVMDVAQGVNSYEAGYILPLRQDAFGGISNMFCGDNVENALPMNMPYDNTNDIGYMAGNNKVQVTVDPPSQESNVIDLLSSKANGLYIPGSSIQELTITFDFPESMPLREMFVAGQNMPKSVLFEYKDTNGTYHELVERERGVDYSSASGQSAYAYWQFMYGTLQFTDNFANGVRITINSDDEVSYMLTRIYIGVARVLMPNKYGDDLVATSLKIKDGNDYYTLSIQNGQVVATLDT